MAALRARWGAASTVRFPLLCSRVAYAPSCFLLTEPSERAYWLGVLEQGTPALARHAARSRGGSPADEAAAAAFASAFSGHLLRLREPAQADGVGTDTVLALREAELRAAGFTDVYALEKQADNEEALTALPAVLAALDALPPGRARLAHAVHGLLAGNVLDLGAAAIAQMRTEGKAFNWGEALELSMKGGKAIDDMDTFLSYAYDEDRSPSAPLLRYAKVVVFPDNAGIDFCCGVIPLARELLRQGARVLVAANEMPAINDVTAVEAARLVEAAAGVEEAIGIASLLRPALRSGSLQFFSTGQGTPCIDLSAVPRGLADAAKDADLVILEGMGRALHTNFSAVFSCDSLKAALLKSAHVAGKLNAKMFDSVLRFELGSSRGAAAPAHTLAHQHPQHLQQQQQQQQQQREQAPRGWGSCGFETSERKSG
jgi:uncharacterized protein with ATP-grasp and redox domains